MTSKRALAAVGLPALSLFLLLIAFLFRRGSVPLLAEAKEKSPEQVRDAEGPTSTGTNYSSSSATSGGPVAAGTDAPVRRVIRVGDREGRPLKAKVRIAFSRDGFSKFETLDLEPDASGELSINLDPRAWVVVSVQAPGSTPTWQPPAVWGDLDPKDLSFALPAGPRVDGTSRWADGKPMAGVRLSFAPSFPPGEYSGVVASKLKIVDEEVTTDADGKFQSSSLRPGGYRVSFPDHPKWPALNVPADAFKAGTVDLRAYWQAPLEK